MYSDTPPRSVDDRGSALEEFVAGIAATAIVAAALGGAYATTVVLGPETAGAYPLAALVGLTIVVAVPVGAALCWRTAVEELEDRRSRRTRRAPDAGPSCESEPESGPLQADAHRTDD